MDTKSVDQQEPQGESPSIGANDSTPVDSAQQDRQKRMTSNFKKFHTKLQKRGVCYFSQLPTKMNVA